MAYYDALVAKWATLTGTTQARLDAVNALTIPGPNVPVPVLQVMTYLRENNLWMAIKAATATSAGAAAAVDYNSDPRVQTLDVSLAIVQGMLADLVTHGLLSQAQSDAIVAMGAPPVLWWQANGYTGPFSAPDLQAAGGLT
ncbi:MAG TPA: hypothetical protein VIO16_06020 [Dehalococcoidia bacterium]